MHPTDTLISAPTAEMISDFFFDIENCTNFEELIMENFEINNYIPLLYKCFCAFKDIEPSYEYLICECCQTRNYHFNTLNFKLVDNSIKRMCKECIDFYEENYPEKDSQLRFRKTLLNDKEEMECPICYDTKLCYQFFKCDHKCCFDCLIQMEKGKCYYNCDQDDNKSEYESDFETDSESA